MSQKRVALLASELSGGIGRVLNHLARCFADENIQVDILLDRTHGQFVAGAREVATVRRLRTSHAWSGVPSLLFYLWTVRPDAVVTSTPRLTHLAIRAVRLLRRRPLVAAVVHNTYSLKFQELPEAKRGRRLSRMRRLYPEADRIIAVSHGVADDLVNYVGIPENRVEVIHNPVVPPDGVGSYGRGNVVAGLRKSGEQVLVAMGRLSPAKDFTTLLRAFSIVRQKRAARLVVFGKGYHREALLAVADELGVADCAHFPGHTEDPYAELAAADLFVLSSRWEGFGNVVVEAMAVGTAVVATDCPSGPREILGGGEFGALVPVGDAEAMADAVVATLMQPPDADELRRAAARFESHFAARRYIERLQLTPPAAPMQPE